MNTFDERESATIGGETFRAIRTRRGASALGGFHSHQKQLLGTFGRHAVDAGLAILSDGTARWNRKRQNEATPRTTAIPLVFAGGLLQDVNTLHQRLTGDKLYPELVRFEETTTINAPICCCAVQNACKQPRRKDIVLDAARLRDQLRASQQRRSSGNTPFQLEAIGAATSKGATKVEPPAAQTPEADRATVPRMAEKLHAEALDTMPHIAKSAWAGCRHCRMVGTTCRLYKRIQWCAQKDIAFDAWVTDVFPGRKAAALAAATRRAVRATGRRGRPKQT